MVLERNGQTVQFVKEEVPVGKADTLQRIKEAGGVVHTQTEIVSSKLENDQFVFELNNGESIICDMIIVQIGFLSAKETFKKLNFSLLFTK